MKRKEEIEKAAAKFDGSMDCVGCFIGGAEWADEHPRKGLVDIEKVCEFIKEAIPAYFKDPIKESLLYDRAELFTKILKENFMEE